MEFLYLLENIRVPFLDTFFSIITVFGEEFLFMVVAMIFFWCVDKYDGYYFFTVSFLGIVVNQFLKILFRIPRPFVKDPSFTIVESAREAASGFSFPSGHTSVSVSLYGGIFKTNKNKALNVICIALCVLVPFSRLYLGVHTPLDVGVSVVLSFLFVIIGHIVFTNIRKNPNIIYFIFLAIWILSIGFLLFVTLYPFGDEVTKTEAVVNLISARENAYTMLGCIAGLTAVHFIDSRFIRFSVKAPFALQIVKVVIGLALLIAVKEGLRAPLDFICGGHLIARSIRYFLMVIVGGNLWPFVFSKFIKNKA